MEALRTAERHTLDLSGTSVVKPTTTETSVMSLAGLQDLTGRVALVTGGSRGLRLQMAEVLGELGAKVAITARKAGELAEAKTHLAAMGIEALPVVCDMSD